MHAKISRFTVICRCCCCCCYYYYLIFLFNHLVFWTRSLQVWPSLLKGTQRRTCRDFYRPDALPVTTPSVYRHRQKSHHKTLSLLICFIYGRKKIRTSPYLRVLVSSCVLSEALSGAWGLGTTSVKCLFRRHLCLPGLNPSP